VIEAARSLFLERGYGATTIEAVSALADVPPATLYRLFSSKLGILKALLDVSIVGDAETVPMADRPEVRALLAEADPRSKLAGFAKITAQVNSRVAPLHRILVSAAEANSDAAALLDELTHQRQAGQRLIARSLALAGALRPELRQRDAADVIHALMSPELYRLLVLDRHWKSERYERWLASTLADQLLPSKPANSMATEQGRPPATERRT
jgi:AcrR family transcriptional regulator